MTNEPGGSAETWRLDVDGKRLWDSRDPSDCWNIADLAMDRQALCDYLNALEAKAAALDDARAVDAWRCRCPQTVHYAGGQVEWIQMTGRDTACPQHGTARLDNAKEPTP